MFLVACCSAPVQPKTAPDASAYSVSVERPRWRSDSLVERCRAEGRPLWDAASSVVTSVAASVAARVVRVADEDPDSVRIYPHPTRGAEVIALNLRTVRGYVVVYSYDMVETYCVYPDPARRLRVVLNSRSIF